DSPVLKAGGYYLSPLHLDGSVSPFYAIETHFFRPCLAATHEMRMIVDHARNNGLALHVHPPGTGPDEFRYVRIRADGDEAGAFDGHGLYDRETLIHRDDLAVRQDQIRR